MLSALLGDNLHGSFGVAVLEDQTPHERAYSPLPQPDGTLIQDPDFSLPTIAGPLIWRLFHYSALPDNVGSFGRGRRASWPMRLCADVTGSDDAGYIVTTTLEREDGNRVRYIGNSPPGAGFPATFVAHSPRLYDTLVNNVLLDKSWDEQRVDTGATFHYPAGTFTSLAYYKTIQGQFVTMNYNGDGTLDTIQEPAGRELVYSYEGPYVTSVEDWAGREHSFEYDNSDNIISITDPDGAITRFQYNASNNLTLITDPNNYDTAYAYDENNRVTMRSVDGNPGVYSYSGSTTTYLDPRGQTWVTTQDDHGNVTSTTDPALATRTAEYTNDLPTTLTDAIGRPTYLEYDDNGKEIYRQNPNSETTTRYFDAYTNLIWESDPLGRTSYYDYGPDPSMRQRASWQNPMSPPETTYYKYTDWGAVKQVTSPMGHITTYSWSGTGTLDNRQNANGDYAYYFYDDAANRILTIDEMGRPTTLTFDNMGREKTRQTNIGAYWQRSYDGCGNLSEEIDPMGGTVQRRFNAWDKEFWRQDENGNIWQTGYDARGQEVSRTDPLGNMTQTIPDEAQRIVQHIDGMGRSSGTVFNGAREVMETVDKAGLSTYYTYDLAGRQKTRTDPAQLCTTNTYNAAGELTGTQDPTGVWYQHRYDLAGRHKALIEPTGAVTTANYDADGRRVSSQDIYNRSVYTSYSNIGLPLLNTDAGGRVSTTTYDPAGARVLETSWSGHSVQHLYDGAGRAVGTIDELGLRTTSTLDLAGRVTAFQDEIGNLYQTQYLANSLPHVSIDPLGNFTTTTYDAANRPYRVVSPLNKPAYVAYDSSNAVIQTIDVASNPTQFGYDYAGRLQSTQDALGNVVQRFFDGAGRFKSHMDQAGSITTLQFDETGRWNATQDAMGYRFTTQFDPYDRPVGSLDPRGYLSQVSLDLLHRPVQTTDPYGSTVQVAYNILSQVDQVVDELGNPTQHLYDGRFNYVGTRDAYGSQVTVTRDMYSRPVLYTDQLGNQTETLYDGFSRPHMSIDSYGGCVTTVFDTYGRVWQEHDEAGNISWTLYDGLGRYTGSQDAQGNLSQTLYDDNGRVASNVDPQNNSTQYFYDSLNRVQIVRDTLNQTTTHLYDSRGNRAVTVDALGRRVSLTHDPLNRLYTQVDLGGAGSVYLYDPVSNLAQETDASGQTTVYSWDGLNRLVSSSDPTGAVTQSRYDRRSSRVAQIDAQGRVTTTAFDALQRPIATENALGFTYTYVYNRASRVTARINPRGYAVSLFYDNLNRPIQTEDQLGNVTETVYDSRSNPVSAIDAYGYRWTAVFDSLNRRVADISPMGYCNTTVYDSRSLEVARISPLGLTATTQYDALQRRTASVTPDGARWTTIYDAVSNPIAEITPLGCITTALYDVRNRTVGYVDPLGRQQTMTWDVLNRLTTYQDQKGQITTHFYDARNLEIQREYCDGSLLTLSYNSLRQPTNAQDGSGLYTMSYDLLDRVLTVNAPGHPKGWPVSHLYDENSNLTTASTPWGLFSYSWDPRDQISTLKDPGYPAAGVAGGTTSFQHDARGLTVRQDNVNSTRTTMVYDPNSRLMQKWHFTSASAEIDHVVMAYDSDDRPITRSTHAGTSTFGYDLCDRVLTEWDPVQGRATIGYDLAGHRTALVNPTGRYSYQYDAADQLTSQQTPTGSVSYNYDANGSRTLQVAGTARTSYQWDPRNRLQQITLPTGAAYTQTYRPDDMRLRQSGPTGVTTLVWTGVAGGGGYRVSGSGNASASVGNMGVALPEALGMVSTQSGSPMQQVFAHDVSAQNPVPDTQNPIPKTPNPASLVRALGVHADGSPINRQFHLDNQGSALDLTTATGSIEAAYHTDAWGNVISGTAADNPYIYLGGLGYWQEGALNLNYVRARWQEVSTGSWLSVDSVRTQPRYQYASNSPTRLVDPSGRQVEIGQSSTGSFADDLFASVFGKETLSRARTYATAINAVGGAITGALLKPLRDLQADLEHQYRSDPMWKKLPAVFYNLRPPYVAVLGVGLRGTRLGVTVPLPSNEWGGWAAGFAAGAAETAYWLSPAGDVHTVIQLIFGLFHAMVVGPSGVERELVDFLSTTILGYQQLFTNHVDLDAHTRGYMLATLLGGIVTAVLMIGAALTGVGLVLEPFLATQIARGASHAAKAIESAAKILKTTEEQTAKLAESISRLATTHPEFVTPEGLRIGGAPVHDGNMPNLSAAIKKRIANYMKDGGTGGLNELQLSGLTIDEAAAVREALDARRTIGTVKGDQTIAAVRSGTRTISGYAPGAQKELTDLVRAKYAELGIRLRSRGGLDQGIPGEWLASHAEAKMAIVAPGQPIAVSRVQCQECQELFKMLAIREGVTLTVADPKVTRVFRPNGDVQVITAPWTLQGLFDFGVPKNTSGFKK